VDGYQWGGSSSGFGRPADDQGRRGRAERSGAPWDWLAGGGFCPSGVVGYEGKRESNAPKVSEVRLKLTLF